MDPEVVSICWIVRTWTRGFWAAWCFKATKAARAMRTIATAARA